MNLQISIMLIFALIALLCVIGVFLLYKHYPLHLILKSKSGFQDMLDGVSDPLVEISENYIVKRANKAYSTFTNLPFSQIIGQKCFFLLRKRHLPCEECKLKLALESKANYAIERSSHPSGKGAISIHFSPCSGAIDIKDQYIIEHIRDITILENLKIDLEKKNESLANTMNHLITAQQKIKDELRMARVIQQGILPEKAPDFPGLHLNILYQPIADVGGDIYDFIRFTPTRLGIFIGDASGHGLSSAFVGTISKMSLYHNSKTELPVNELLSRINTDLLNNIHTSHYLTCFWCIFDTETNTLAYSRAGHPLPVVIKKDGTIYQLNSNGTFMGIMEKAIYDVNTVHLDKNDRIFFFTDGIYEALEPSSKSKDIMGYDKFVNILSKYNYIPFNKIIPSIQDQLATFNYTDDYTLIALEVDSNKNETGLG